VRIAVSIKAICSWTSLSIFACYTHIWCAVNHTPLHEHTQKPIQHINTRTHLGVEVAAPATALACC